MKKFPLLLCLVYLITTSFYPASSEDRVSYPRLMIREIKLSAKKNFSPQNPAEEIYKELRFTDETLNFEVFEKAFLGFQNLKKSENWSRQLSCFLFVILVCLLTETTLGHRSG
jgi:hypothetical protein